MCFQRDWGAGCWRQWVWRLDNLTDQDLRRQILKRSGNRVFLSIYSYVRLLLAISEFVWVSVCGWPCLYTICVYKYSKFEVSLVTVRTREDGREAAAHCYWYRKPLAPPVHWVELLKSTTRKKMKKWENSLFFKDHYKGKRVKCGTMKDHYITTSEVLHITAIQLHSVISAGFIQLMLNIPSRKAVPGETAFLDSVFENMNQAIMDLILPPSLWNLSISKIQTFTSPWPTLAQTLKWQWPSRCSDKCSDRSTNMQRSKRIQSQFKHSFCYSC